MDTYSEWPLCAGKKYLLGYTVTQQTVYSKARIFRQRIVQDRSFQIEQAYRKSLCIWVVLKVFKNRKRNVLKNNSFRRVKKSPSGKNNSQESKDV